MISKEILTQLLNDSFYGECIRAKENSCRGRITFEHTLVFAGKQVQEIWAIVPLCSYHHEVDEFQDNGDLQKEIGQWVALNRAKRVDFNKYPRNDWANKKRYLNAKYGVWKN